MSKELTEEQKKRINNILCDKIGVNPDDIEDDSNIRNDLGLDSLDEVEVIMEIEREFDIQIPDDTADSVETIKDYYRIVSQLI